MSKPNMYWVLWWQEWILHCKYNLSCILIDNYIFCENIYVAMPSRAIVSILGMLSVLCSPMTLTSQYPLNIYMHVRKRMLWQNCSFLLYWHGSIAALENHYKRFLISVYSCKFKWFRCHEKKKKTVTIFLVLLWDLNVLQCDSFVCIYERYMNVKWAAFKMYSS